MPYLKTIAIIAATLLLVAGAGAGGYYASESQKTSAAASGSANMPHPFQNAVPKMNLDDGEGSTCDFDAANGVAECTYSSGVRQFLSRDADTGNIHVQTTTSADDECTEDTIEIPKKFNSQSKMSVSDAESLVTLASQTKRVTSWIIQVPKELGGDSLDQFEYFEKDGEPWRVEAFEAGEKDPVVVELSELAETWTAPSLSKTCNNPQRNLLETIGQSSSDVSLRGSHDRRLHPVFVLFKGGMLLGGAVIGTMLVGQCLDDACGCRRRRFLSERGPMEDLDISSVAGAIASAAATVTAAAAIASAVPSSDSMRLTDAIAGS